MGGQAWASHTEGQEAVLGGLSVAVQWLGLGAFTAKGTGSVPGRGTKTPQASQRGQKNKTNWGPRAEPGVERPAGEISPEPPRWQARLSLGQVGPQGAGWRGFAAIKAQRRLSPRWSLPSPGPPPFTFLSHPHASLLPSHGPRSGGSYLAIRLLSQALWLYCSSRKAAWMEFLIPPTPGPPRMRAVLLRSLLCGPAFFSKISTC